jgi:hypothetical protein
MGKPIARQSLAGWPKATLRHSAKEIAAGLRPLRPQRRVFAERPFAYQPACLTRLNVDRGDLA